MQKPEEREGTCILPVPLFGILHEASLVPSGAGEAHGEQKDSVLFLQGCLIPAHRDAQQMWGEFNCATQESQYE